MTPLTPNKGLRKKGSLKSIGGQQANGKADFDL